MTEIKKPFVLVTYGTSLTTGRLSSRWPELLREVLAAQPEAVGPIYVYNMGRGSQNSDWGVVNVSLSAGLRPSHILSEGFAINDSVVVGTGLITNDMTSNSSNGTALASSEWAGGGYEAFRAFDGDVGTNWWPDEFSVSPWHIIRGWTTTRSIDRYTLSPVGGGPRSWQLQGSNSSGGPWVTLDTRSAQSGYSSSTFFTTSIKTAYLFHRLLITEANTALPALNELTFYEDGTAVSRFKHTQNMAVMRAAWKAANPNVIITWQTMNPANEASAALRPNLAAFYADEVSYAASAGDFCIDNYGTPLSPPGQPTGWPKPLPISLTYDSDGLHPLFDSATEYFLFPNVLFHLRKMMASYWGLTEPTAPATFTLGDLTISFSSVNEHSNLDKSLGTYSAPSKGSTVFVTDDSFSTENNGNAIFLKRSLDFETGVVNNLLHSEDLTNAVWTKNSSSVVGNNANGPTGLQIADTLTVAASVNSNVSQTIVAPGANVDYVYGSVWLRSPSGPSQTAVRINSTGYNDVQVCDLTTEWKRFNLRSSASGGQNITFSIGNTNTTVYSATTIEVWGAQLNANKDYLTFSTQQRDNFRYYRNNYLGSSSDITSSSAAGGFENWRAFSPYRDAQNGWRASSTSYPQWIARKFSTPVLVTGYNIYCDTSSSRPKTWTLEASNDGVNWLVIHRSQYQCTFYNNIFSFDNNTPYTNYRLNITDGSSPGTAVGCSLMLGSSIFLRYSRTVGAVSAYHDLIFKTVEYQQGISGSPKAKLWTIPVNNVTETNTASDFKVIRTNTNTSGSWVVPDGITSISVVCVGAGGYSTSGAFGGGGGALSYRNAITVTPGETLTWQCGWGLQTRLRRGSTDLCIANCGDVNGIYPGFASSGISGMVSYSGGYGGYNDSPDNDEDGFPDYYFDGSGGGAGDYSSAGINENPQPRYLRGTVSGLENTIAANGCGYGAPGDAFGSYNYAGSNRQSLAGPGGLCILVGSGRSFPATNTYPQRTYEEYVDMVNNYYRTGSYQGSGILIKHPQWYENDFQISQSSGNEYAFITLPLGPASGIMYGGSALSLTSSASIFDVTRSSVSRVIQQAMPSQSDFNYIVNNNIRVAGRLRCDAGFTSYSSNNRNGYTSLSGSNSGICSVHFQELIYWDGTNARLGTRSNTNSFPIYYF